MNAYHCTWRRCQRPVFSLTLCRGHFRAFKVPCAWPLCHRVSFCRQVCARHYRKKEFVERVRCESCQQSVYIGRKCFYHYTTRTCIRCDSKVFSRQLCQRHYMREYREKKRMEQTTSWRPSCIDAGLEKWVRLFVCSDMPRRLLNRKKLLFKDSIVI